MKSNLRAPIASQIIEEAIEWTMMHGVAFRQADMTAKHCPFSIAPMNMDSDVFEHLLKVTPLITKLIHNVSEDHDFLQSALADVAKADPFFERIVFLHQQIHGDSVARFKSKRKPLLLMRTDFMEDGQHGAKVIEFNGIAAGMAPFGQRATELHAFLSQQWPQTYSDWLEDKRSTPAVNHGLDQLALGISNAAREVKSTFALEAMGAFDTEDKRPTFLMVVQSNEDNVYDQHLLELALQKQGIRTVRRTFEQLSTQLSTGEGHRLILEDVGAIDLVYLRAGYQYCDYYSPDREEAICCHALSQTRLFIEQHHVAVNATFSQQLATSKTMQMLLTTMPMEEYARWGLNLAEAQLVKSVLAEMKPINQETMDWFHTQANKQQWVLKNQGEGGGHCVFGDDISERLKQLKPEELDAWAFMQRLYPHVREVPTIAVRDGVQVQVDDLVSEIGLFTAYFDGKPVTEMDGYAGYLIRSKPASEDEGGIHSGKGILDSLALN
ncbi:glutathione synthase [Vibrio inusitatus NBRC 102082]|uniref:glutathione synthase n=1 Tax=Vibrio inusitatus NBRC 102082 TaxID=1219070 RepID=A0A4Y3HXA7_9VIBR|nr:glutathione synthase [Vibrio inusitatus]GEA51809.1 glutathione synthase [Vibrio inusitatus NBRC 102082]